MTGISNKTADLTAGTDSECSVRLVDGGKVALVKSQMPQDIDVVELAAIFGLLSDPGRVRILTALLSGEMCVCDLAATTDLSESGVSHALRLLRASRVVEVRRSGRMAYYSLADSHVSILLDLGLKHVGHTGQQRQATANLG